jgi:glutathione synthase/RimK-type ligase-like ATP-grasp enzyme
VSARPRVALATFTGFPDLWEDDRLLLEPLAALGVDAEPAVWDDAAVDWAAYDLVVVRSTWDYTWRRDDFLDWAASVPALLNPVEVLSWNTDKRYLAELAAAGVPVVPTTFVAPHEEYVPPTYEHVVKPTVSAGSRDTRRFAVGEDSRGHAEALLAAGRTVMVQPYQAAVDEVGETAVISFAGVHSHAARKGPVLVPELADPHDVSITSARATPEQLAVAAAALERVPWPEPLLYARVDVVPGPDGAPVVMELEVTEPSLFLGTAPGAAERLAAAIRSHLS